MADPFADIVAPGIEGFDWSKIIPGAGLAMTGVGLLGGISNKPKVETLDYDRSDELQEAFSTLLSLPEFQEQLSALNKGTIALAGQTKREGAREIKGSLADPGQIAKFVSELESSVSGQVGAQMGRNYQTAYGGALQKGGTLGNLSLNEEDLKKRIEMFNIGQKQAGSDYMGELFGNLGMGGAYMLGSAFNQ